MIHKIRILLGCLSIAAAFYSNYSIAAEAKYSVPSFVEASTDILPIEDRSRRKWDSAIIADMDKDGWMDMILTEHGHRVNLFWNNQGTFSEADVVMHGDIHGQTVADFNRDGLMDLIVYPGGGGGNNPRQPAAFVMSKRSWEGGEAFAHFERTRGRVVKLVDVDQDGQLELISTGFALNREPQKSGGAIFLHALDENNVFQFVSKLPFAKDRLTDRILVTDYNNDNDPDLIIFGGNKMVVAKGEEGKAFSDATEEVLGDLCFTSTVTSVNQIDFDNDGDFDLFITRSEHPFKHKSYHDEDCGCFAFFSRFKPMEMDDLKIDGDFKLENLQMAYPHFDVLVGEEKRALHFDVDRHGHKDFSLTQEESIGWPDDLSDFGLYVGFLGDDTWRIYSNTKSPTAGVIHNVVSSPTTVDPKDMPALLLENRDGVFVDVAAMMGISIQEQTTGCSVADFDNDGWSDLFVVRHGNPATETEEILYLNKGGKAFVRAEDHGIVSSELGSTGMAPESFDYDQDGDLNLIYCTERGRWHLYQNELAPKANNYAIVKIGYSPSGEATWLGARLTLKAGGQTYQRVVGAGSAAYGQSANYYLHVGLGEEKSVDSAVVHWTNGETVVIEDLELNSVTQVGVDEY